MRIGDARSLCIGPACSNDIEHLARGETIASPAIHRDTEAFPHFDLMEPVIDQDGALRGYVFASFFLSGLSDFTDNLIRDGHRVSLDVNAAMRRVDAALYGSKQAGKNRIKFAIAETCC